MDGGSFKEGKVSSEGLIVRQTENVLSTFVPLGYYVFNMNPEMLQ